MHPGSQIDAVYLCREPVDFRNCAGYGIMRSCMPVSADRSPFLLGDQGWKT